MDICYVSKAIVNNHQFYKTNTTNITPIGPVAMCDAFASPAPARCLATCSTVPAIFRGFHEDIDVKALAIGAHNINKHMHTH